MPLVLDSMISVKSGNILKKIKFRYEDYPPSWLEFKLAVTKEFALTNKQLTVKTEGGLDLERVSHRFQNIILLRPASTFYVYTKDGEEDNQGSTMSKKVLIGLGIGAGVVVGAAAAPALIAAAGFTSGGVAAGSVAASWMSASGPIVAGSLFASLQSAGAVGLGAAGFAAAATAGAAAGGATVMGASAAADIVAKMRKKDGNEPDPMMPFILLPNGDGLILFRRPRSGTSAEGEVPVNSSRMDSYKSRSVELKKFFRDLPSYEFLIADYSCDLKRSTSIKGRIYLTPNYCCFFSNSLGVEIKQIIRTNEITEITKERSAYVFPNAVQITTSSEKYFFTSFATRDQTFDLLDYLWKKSLSGEVTFKIEMLPLIVIIYGEDLGFANIAELIQEFI